MVAVLVSRRTGQRIPTQARGGPSPTTRPDTLAQDVQRTEQRSACGPGADHTFPDAASLRICLSKVTNLLWISPTWPRRENTAGSVEYNLSRLVARLPPGAAVRSRSPTP